MAAQEAQPLLTLGPFIGLDVTKAGPTVEPGYAVAASNANPTIIENALTTERGRINMNDFPGVSITVVVSVMQYFITGNSFVRYLIGGTSGGLFVSFLWDAVNGRNDITYAGTSPTAIAPFDQAIQYGGVVYLNNGYRLFLNQNTLTPAYNVLAWQYPPPPQNGNLTIASGAAIPAVLTTSQTAVPNAGSVIITPVSMTGITPGDTVVVDSGSAQEFVLVSGTTGTTFTAPFTMPHSTGFFIGSGIVPATYEYLMTRVSTMPDGTTSESSADPLAFASPPQITTTAASEDITLTPINGNAWSGTQSLDGLAYTTNIYRASTLQPTFFLVANTGTLGPTATFTDISPDQAIVGNVQLETRDQPPLVPGSFGVDGNQFNLGSICLHKSRAWVYVIAQTVSDNNVPEVQLWYSNLGRPWEFDQVNQVILLQSDVVNQYGNLSVLDASATYDNVYGNDPLGMAEVGTFLMAHSRRQTWAIYGDSPANFLARQNFNIGCVSRHSITSTTGGEFWLSENGAYWFDGSTPQYIDGSIRGLLQAQPGSPAVAVADQRQSTGYFSNMIWYLAFPTLDFTLPYATVQGKWLSTLPYAPSAPAAVSFTPAYPSQYSLMGTLGSINEVVAARGTKTSSVDWLFADPDFDLGLPQTCSWTGPLSFCGENKDSWEKIFSHLTLTGPAQPGSAIVTLTVDPGVATSGDTNTFTWTIADLSTATRQITSVGDGSGGQLRGFIAQLSVEMTGVAGQQAPQLWKVTAWGSGSRNLVLPA